MSDFNSMTVMAAGEIIAEMSTQAEFMTLVTGWGVQNHVGSGAVLAKATTLVQYATSESHQVPTVQGKCDLKRAIVEHAINAHDRINEKATDAWARLVAGLKMDGFEIGIEEMPDASTVESPFGNNPKLKSVPMLRRMLPGSIPETDFREAEDEVSSLLRKHGLDVAEGHLTQAISAFSRGEWAAANAMIRDFYQELLDKIAESLGCDPSVSDDDKRQYLAKDDSGPFLIHEYNEWENDRKKPAFVLGLWARLHPHGSHPGLSDEEDCAFRFQIILITARLFLRRFNERMRGNGTN